MYTKCPDCSIAFRVTADVLKQAAGQVRCGGCGNAFNALAFLSENMPDQATIGPAAATTPELAADRGSSSEGMPESISAEQSAALLKTLDELAGSDIRIEDTGVEWRVFDDDNAARPTASNEASGADAAASHVDELLDDAQTPLDEFLTATPEVVDAPEIFSAEANGLAKTPVDELRFDDNTPLPDDFDLDDEASFIPAVETNDGAEAEAESFEAAFDDSAADIELTAPEEWDDILDEFDEPADDDSVRVEAFAVDDAEEIVLADDNVSDDGTAARDSRADQLPDTDTQFALQAAAMGIEHSGAHNTDDAADADASVPAVDAVDDEAAEQEATDEAPSDTVLHDFDDLDDPVEFGQLDEPDDIGELDDADEPDEPDESDESDDLDELATSQDDDLEAAGNGDAHEDDDDTPDDLIEDQPDGNLSDSQQLFQLLPDDPDEAADEEPAESELTGKDNSADEAHADEDEDEDLAQLDLIHDEKLIDEPFIENHDIENELSMLDSSDAADEPDAADSGEHYVPPLTEEEQTVNMQIDQDLMALAIQDEDGFASTIIIPQEDAEAALAADFSEADFEEPAYEDRPGFETIIMEGENVRSDADAEKRAADAAAAAELAAIARQKEAEDVQQTGGMHWGMVGGAIALLLLLGLQLMHQSRETLATSPLFSNTIGKVYRAVGAPIQPAWDITGWRIEASNDRVDVEENGENLTVEIRIGNNSDAPLPYPLVSISLTDRFLEPVGNRILDPAQYLQDGVDPRELVEPGDTFRALASIESPSIDASGYKVDVCYRNSDSRLRCAIDDFK